MTFNDCMAESWIESTNSPVLWATYALKCLNFNDDFMIILILSASNIIPTALVIPVFLSFSSEIHL